MFLPWGLEWTRAGQLGPDLDQALLEFSWNPETSTRSLVGLGAKSGSLDQNPMLGFLSWPRTLMGQFGSSPLHLESLLL